MLGLEPVTVLLVALIAFATAVLHSFSGFAGGLMLVIGLAPLLGVKEVVPVSAVAMMVSNTSRLWVFRKAVEWRVFAAVFLAALPGLLVGIAIYISLPVGAIAVILGLFLLSAVAMRHVLEWRSFVFSRRSLGYMGIPFGLISGVTPGAGLLLVPFLMSAGLVGEKLVAMGAALGFGMNMTKAGIFGLSPLLTLPLTLIGVLVGLSMIPGAYCGRWLVRRTKVKLHSLFMDCFVSLGSLYFFWRAWQEFSSVAASGG